MPRLKALFFDLDQTLARDSHSARLSAQRVFPLIQKRLPDYPVDDIHTIYREINTRHWEDFDASPISKLECSLQARTLIWKDVLNALQIDDTTLAEQIATEFQKAREETYFLYDDTAPALDRLKTDYPMVLVTNGHSQMQRKKIEVTKIEPFIQHVFIAQEVGASKPNAPIFEKALEATGTKPHEALMVGDHPEKDINGAKALGINTAWMRRSDSKSRHGDPEANHTLTTMQELLDLIDTVYV